MRRAFQLQEHAYFEAGELSLSVLGHLRDAQRRVVANALELHRLFKPVAGNIGLHLGYHGRDALCDCLAVAILRQAIDRVAHHQRRLGGIDDDYRLAPRCATDIDDGLRSGLGELVDVCARAGSGAFAGGAAMEMTVNGGRVSDALPPAPPHREHVRQAQRLAPHPHTL